MPKKTPVKAQFVVLRVGQGDSFEMLAHTTPAHDTMAAADVQAAGLRDRYTQQAFVIARVVRYYSHVHRAQALNIEPVTPVKGAVPLTLVPKKTSKAGGQ